MPWPAMSGAEPCSGSNRLEKRRSGRAGGYVSSGANGSRGEVDNNLWSALFTYSLAGHELGAGYEKVIGNSATRTRTA